MSAPRYEVCTIEGWEIGRGQHAGSCWWVADRWYGFREVATFRPNKALHRVTARQRAETLRAEANAAHDAWMRDNGYALVHSSVEGGDK